jgi:hypothetical protein
MEEQRALNSATIQCPFHRRIGRNSRTSFSTARPTTTRMKDPADVEAAWAEEIKRRVDEIRNGTAETYALEDVLAEMEKRYA